MRLAADPLAPDGMYLIDPDGAIDTSTDAADVYCDMNTLGGGWTEVHAFGESDVDLLLGSSARQLVNGMEQTCGTDPEYTDVVCPSWWGFGCGNGPFALNKLFPRVLDAPAAGTCADDSSAHTNGAFSICGSNNYRAYRVFVRSEDPAPTCSAMDAPKIATAPPARSNARSSTCPAPTTPGSSASAWT